MSRPRDRSTHRSDAEGRELNVADLTEAQVLLLLHRLDPASEGCAACGRPSPCATSRDAAEVLALAGAWNTLEVPSHFAPPSALFARSPQSLDGLAQPAPGKPEPAPGSRGRAVGRVRLLLRSLARPGRPRRGRGEQ